MTDSDEHSTLLADLIKAVISFIVQAPGINVLKLFYFAISVVPK